MHSEDINGKTLEHWDCNDLQQALEKNVIVLIDVRTPPEYMFEYIRGALLLPMAAFDTSFLPEGGSKQLVFHCGSGVRSRKVAEACLAAGHERAAHLEGGFAAWKAAHKPYVGTDMASGAPVQVG
ncbi:rhodanese-related sulfurtransferase [Rhodovulum imhoffii]|uniref:Rhodanese-related sulfurtransferase n=1 Tax=Rhodovulum imhoffii TaxID=365340 RepID=A0A2T5BWM0_9RHOB|nr:rhodanese-like domain-containing protein [Rhodovulum imhoffii]MBK5935013.1 sulfurtransferase [Rhodovulum imhoffii]PTN04023.1 rhodanese-related sulfurtransferase [Rhodovulum imhoffii]